MINRFILLLLHSEDVPDDRPVLDYFNCMNKMDCSETRRDDVLGHSHNENNIYRLHTPSCRRPRSPAGPQHGEDAPRPIKEAIVGHWLYWW